MLQVPTLTQLQSNRITKSEMLLTVIDFFSFYELLCATFQINFLSDRIKNDIKPNKEKKSQ